MVEKGRGTRTAYYKLNSGEKCGLILGIFQNGQYHYQDAIIYCLGILFMQLFWINLRNSEDCG